MIVSDANNDLYQACVAFMKAFESGDIYTKNGIVMNGQTIIAIEKIRDSIAKIEKAQEK